ncbi:MAG: hypothetical protein ACOVKS_07230 [Aquimonas sp.]|jgi:hypothetical protein
MKPNFFPAPPRSLVQRVCTVTVFLPDLGAWESILANAVKATLGPKGRNPRDQAHCSLAEQRRPL